MPKLVAYLSFVLCLVASYFIIPTDQKDFFNIILVWLLPIIEISIIIIVIYGIAKGVILFKNINSNEHLNFKDVIRKSLEPKLGNGFVLEVVLTELSVFYYSILVWFKKPKISSNDTYTYHRTSQIKPIVIVFSILIILEGVLFHFLIQQWNDLAAWIFTVLNIYALLYMVGLYNSVKYLPHMFKQDKLIIQLGYQSSIEVEITNIKHIKTAKKQDGIGTKIPKDTYFSLLNIDTPQYELFLKEPVLMRGAYGRKKYVKTVVFRSDNPNQMINKIDSIISCHANENA